LQTGGLKDIKVTISKAIDDLMMINYDSRFDLNFAPGLLTLPQNYEV